MRFGASFSKQTWHPFYMHTYIHDKCPVPRRGDFEWKSQLVSSVGNFIWHTRIFTLSSKVFLDFHFFKVFTLSSKVSSSWGPGYGRYPIKNWQLIDIIIGTYNPVRLLTERLHRLEFVIWGTRHCALWHRLTIFSQKWSCAKMGTSFCFFICTA
jgi:hypothetical protein